MNSLPKTCVANQATIPPKINATVPPLPSFKLPRLALQSAGVALLASTALVLAPLDAQAGPTIPFASPEVKKTLEVRERRQPAACISTCLANRYYDSLLDF